jgi:predicted branched-subunit amino acid permease
VSANSIRNVKRDSFTVAFTVGAYGIAFGAAAVADHFTEAQACVLSQILLSGASQFAVVGVMGAGGSALSAIATSTLLGTRNTLYGVRLSPILNHRGIKRALGAQITIDESTGVSLSQESRGESAMREGFWLTGFGVFIFWNLFTLAGALGAKAMGNPSAWGLDAAVPAAFLGLVWPRLKNTTDKFLALTAAVFAIVTTPYLPAGLPIIGTAVIAIIAGVRKAK